MIENKLAEIMAKKKIDSRDLVKMTGLDNHTVRKIYKGEISRIELNTLNKICYALECNVGDILNYKED